MTEVVGAGPRIAFADPQVNFYVGDIEGSLRFYRDALGFTETFRTPLEGAPAHVELHLGPFKLGIASYDSAQRDHGISTGRGPARSEVVLFTEDVDGAYEWSTSHGATALSPPHDFGGYIHSARVADPEGNPVGFTTRLPVQRGAQPTVRPTFTNHLFNVYTEDLPSSLRFYRDLVGFAETFRAPQHGPPDHVEMELGPLNLSVSTLDALKRDHGLSGGGGPPRGEVVLWVTDLDAAYSRMRAEGVPSLSPPHGFANGLRAAWVGDPDGNPVQLVTRTRGP